MTLHIPYQPGDTIKSQNTNDDIAGLATGDNDTANNSLSLFRAEMFEDAFVRGTCKWSKINNLIGTMTLGAYYLRGVRYLANGISSYTFPNNADTYVYLNEAQQISYVQRSNGQASPTKNPNQILVAIIVTQGGQIINIIQQGVDSLGNYIYNTGLIGKGTSAFDVSVPIGSFMMWPGLINSIPSGWLWCNGASVSKTQYAALYNVINTIYSGNLDANSATFLLPDESGQFQVGVDATQTEFRVVGKRGGEKAHTLTWDEMPNHGHGVGDPGHDHYSIDPGQGQTLVTNGGSNNHTSGQANYQGVTWGNTTTSRSGTGIYLGNAGGGQPHNNLPPYSVKLPIIKAF